MSNDEIKDTYKSSLEEYQKFNNFKLSSQETNHNFSFITKPNSLYSGLSKLDIKKEKMEFYSKYDEFVTNNIAQPFFLEEELFRKIKNWHSTSNEFKLPVLTLDNFFNEENVKSHLLKDKYINKNPSVINFYLIDYIITILEEKAFDKILIEGITTYQEEQSLIGLVGPIIDRDLIYHIIKEDIEEKLNILYKENTLGYSYIAENIICFDLFIIYLILKNYPFYILRRERLEEIFDQVKKFKSFPYPIGSIGMDLFKLLIKELYLPGVTLFQEIQKYFLLDLIDPKLLEIESDYFIKVIAFSVNETVYGMSYEKNNKNMIIDIENINENNKSKNKNNIKEKKGKKKDTVKLNLLKDFTLTSYGIYSAYILYANDDLKEEKESNYLSDILGIFEKRYKAKKEEKIEKKDISEKNIINNIFNLIDIGLDSNFALFSKQIKIINDKLIAKTKEIHDSTTNLPRDNINLRRFLNHKITFLNYKYLEKNTKRFIPKKVIFEDEISTSNKNKININNKIDTKYSKYNNINNINNNYYEENELEENDEKFDTIKQKKECLNDIKKYKKILDDEKRVNSDEILENYVTNFINLKEKYFSHLKKIDPDEDSDDEETIKNKQKINIISAKREENLPKLYNQKYLITEDQFLDFLKLLFIWKLNINPFYHKKLYEEFLKKEQQKIKENKNKKKNSLFKDFDIFEDEYPENDNDFSNIPLLTISQLRDDLEKIIKSKLYFNNKIYLIPGQINKSITRHISRNDYIYKSTVGNLFMTFFEEKLSKDSETMIKMPLEIYLKEAKHFYDLTVFKAKIEINDENNEIKENKNYLKLNLFKNYYLLYGGFHIEISSPVKMILDDEKTIKFASNEQNMLYIDIINIYNFENDAKENENNQSKKINDIERFLAYPISNKFQIFISAVKDNPNPNIENENNQNQYFQRYIGNLLNFDIKSAYYESKKIILKSHNFTIIPTFMENIVITNCSSFEIVYDDNNININRGSNVEEDEEEDEDEELDKENNDLEEITRILEEDKTTSFNIKISTFIDLESNDG